MVWWLAMAGAGDVLVLGDSYLSTEGPAFELGEQLPGDDATVLWGRGRTLSHHLERFDVDPDYLPYAGETFSDWMLQENASLAALSADSPMWQDGLDAAVALHARSLDVGSDTWLVVPWAPRRGAEALGFDDPVAMEARIIETMHAYAAAMMETHGQPVWFAPVGEIVSQLHQLEPLFGPDGVHLNGIGMDVASCVVARSLNGQRCRYPPNSPTFGVNLEQALEDALLSDPIDRWPLPWAADWDGETTVSEAGVRPFRRISGEADVDHLQVGDEDGGKGVVQVEVGATLRADRISVVGDSELRIFGTVETDVLDTPVSVVGGRLHVNHLERVPNRWDGGVVRVEEVVETMVAMGRMEFAPGVVVNGDFHLEGQTLELDGGAPIVATGIVNLTGQIVVPSGTRGVILTADQIFVGELDVVGMGSGYTWQLEQDLQSGSIVVTEIRTFGSAGPTPRTCGCESASASGWMALLGLMARRRRETDPAFSERSASR